MGINQLLGSRNLEQLNCLCISELPPNATTDVELHKTRRSDFIAGDAGADTVANQIALAEIASETGFCDQSYFSKVFRRYKDHSPAKYRELHQL